jgi:hypothetical protein
LGSCSHRGAGSPRLTWAATSQLLPSAAYQLMICSLRWMGAEIRNTIQGVVEVIKCNTFGARISYLPHVPGSVWVSPDQLVCCSRHVRPLSHLPAQKPVLFRFTSHRLSRRKFPPTGLFVWSPLLTSSLTNQTIDGQFWTICVSNNPYLATNATCTGFWFVDSTITLSKFTKNTVRFQTGAFPSRQLMQLSHDLSLCLENCHSTLTQAGSLRFCSRLKIQSACSTQSREPPSSRR